MFTIIFFMNFNVHHNTSNVLIFFIKTRVSSHDIPPNFKGVNMSKKKKNSLNLRFGFLGEIIFLFV